MKKLELSFFDTNEKVIVDENALVIAIDNKTTSDGLTECFLLEVNEELPNRLLKRPLMFYIYKDLPILKLYRSAYLSSYQWKDSCNIQWRLTKLNAGILLECFEKV